MRVALLWSMTFLCGHIICQNRAATIDKIVISGNKKTKNKTILNECSFSEGERINQKQIDKEIDRSHANLMNTQLFSDVKIFYTYNAKQVPDVIINIEVKENWYMYPAPLIDVVDRSWTDWWINHKADLKRLNYGLRFSHANLTGRADFLRAGFQIGLTPKAFLEYKKPFSFNSQKYNLELLTEYSRASSVNIATTREKIINENYGEPVLSTIKIEAALGYRKTLNLTHQVRLGYQRRNLNTTLYEDNNNYLWNRDSSQISRYINYSYQHNNQNHALYPSEGFEVQFTLGTSWYGPVNKWIFPVDLKINYAKPLNANIIFFTNNRIYHSGWGSEVPYSENRAFGDGGTFIKGYEKSYIDGQVYWYTRNSVRHLLFKHDRKFWKIFKKEPDFRITTKVYLSTDISAGYAMDKFSPPDNALSNDMLLSVSVGLDVLFMEAFLFQLYLARTKHGTTGFYIKTNVNY